MKATGIVRRIDDLGRVVIPKEIRRTLRIREGDPLEIFVDREGEVILKKYSPIGELGDFAQEYADSLHDATRLTACITDRDMVIAVAGPGRKELMNKPITALVEKVMDERKPVLMTNAAEHPFCEGVSSLAFVSQIIAPIVAEGDPIGSVIIASTAEDGTKVGELEAKLAETAAAFLGKQMEQ